jgi:phosphomannomutase
MIGIADKIGHAIGIVILLQNTNTLCTAKHCVKHCALMITASHNQYTDNGIKLIDNMGFMMDEEIEHMMEQMVNDDQEIERIFKHISNRDSEIYFNDPTPSNNICLLFGMDTRRSCEELKRLIFAGAESIINRYNERNVRNMIGMRSTPETHVCVMRYNLHDNILTDDSETSYYVSSIQGLIKKYDLDLSHIAVDCANGVRSVTLGQTFTGSSSISGSPITKN